MQGMKTLLEVKDVSFSYGNKSIIHNANLKIKEGDFVAIIGPNGAGKTTLIKLMLGILKPYKGSVLFKGKEITSSKKRNKISYVGQDAIIFDQQFPATVYEVVSSGAYISNNFRSLNKKSKQKIEKAIHKVGLYGFKNSLIGELSGGQQQKVFIARALASDAELIVLDEPTNNTDIYSQEELYSHLVELNKKGRTIIVVSHDIGTVISYATSIICIGKDILKHTKKDRFRIEDFKELFKNRDLILHNPKR